MPLYLLSVHSSTNSTHDWIVFENSPKEAINKLNYQLRSRIASLKSEDQKRYLKDWLNALRRYKRKYKPRFGSVNHKALNVYVLPEHFVYSVSYFGVIEGRGHISNYLSEVEIEGTKAL